MDAQSTIAKRVARELQSGMLIKLGIGIPTAVANYIPRDARVSFQSENGLIGTGGRQDGTGHGGAMDLVTDAKRSRCSIPPKENQKIVKKCLPLTSVRPIDLLVSGNCLFRWTRNAHRDLASALSRWCQPWS
jgi:acyl CoA:acetate/3-ketoacid CoA transferase beta subunit